MGNDITSYVTGPVTIKNTGTVNSSEVSNTVLSGFVNSILFVDVITNGTISGKKFYMVNLDNGTGTGYGECIYRGETYSLKEEKGGEYLYTLYGNSAPLATPESDVVSYRIVLRENENPKLTAEAILETATSEDVIPEGKDVISWTNVFTLYKGNENPKQMWSGRAILPSEYDTLVPFTVITEAGENGTVRKYMRVPKYTSVISGNENVEVVNASEDGWYTDGEENFLLSDNSKYYLFVRIVGTELKAFVEKKDDVTTTGLVAIQKLCETNGEDEKPTQFFTGVYPVQYVGDKSPAFSVTAIPEYSNDGNFHPLFIVYIPKNESVHRFGSIIECNTGWSLVSAQRLGFPEGWYQVIKGDKENKLCRLAIWFDKGSKKIKATAYMAKDDADDGEISNILTICNLFEIKNWFDQTVTENWNENSLIKTDWIGPFQYVTANYTAFHSTVLRASHIAIEILFQNCNYYWKREFKSLEEQYVQVSDTGHILLKINKDTGSAVIEFKSGNMIPASKDYCYFALGRVSRTQSDTQFFPYVYMPNSGMPVVGPSFVAGDDTNMELEKADNSEKWKLNIYYK